MEVKMKGASGLVLATAVLFWQLYTGAHALLAWFEKAS